MAVLSGWKNRITSTMRTTSRMNGLLNDSLSLMTLSKKKNLSRIKEAQIQQEAAVESANREAELSATGKSKVKYSVDEINKIIRETIYEQMAEDKFFQTYNPQISSKFCQILSREIIRRIKLLHPNSRYRVVCFVTIIEKLQQATSYKMLFCLDSTNDNFSTFTHEGATFYIVATAFVIYKD